MTRAVIQTKLHLLAEIVGPEDLTGFDDAVSYVLAPDLVAAMTREDVQSSIAAMIEAGLARLPFPCMLVEFEMQLGVRRFVWLKEDALGYLVRTAMFSRHVTTVPTYLGRVEFQSNGLRVIDAANEADGFAYAFGASLALLLLNIRGIEKERIEPVALNRAREKRGVAPIPSHTYLRIGVVYDRDGKPVKGGSALRRVYLRAGHVRQQAVGKGWLEHKLVYIAPQIVNYRPGDEEPSARSKIVSVR